MNTVLHLLGLLVFVALVIAFAAVITAAVVRISPTPTGKKKTVEP